MANDTRPVATPSQVKRIVRRRIARQAHFEEMGLNIYPMMDMMTILLVFLIQSFAQSGAANVVQSAELQIPKSVADEAVEPALSITISASEIVVEGKQALSLRNGQVDPSQKQGGSNGFLVTPLLSVLQQHRDRLKLIAQSRSNKPFRGEVQIIADRRTPYRTLVEVLYTMGQSEFKAMRFVLLKQQGAG
ncbi:MAG TPA: biopolymer transporter ExbD [Polyangiaceae bacterium]|nr:biopolymer transporter ExbD [Polyangiaceae bacterium]